MQPPGFLIRLPRKSFQTDTEAKRCGPLQQTLPNIYKFVCHISCNTLSQLTRHARTLWKLKAQANCYEWATLTNLCVWLGDHWVFWGLTVLSAFLAICGPSGCQGFQDLPIRTFLSDQCLLCECPRSEDICDSWTFGLFNPQYLCVFSDVFVIWTNPASNKS